MLIVSSETGSRPLGVILTARRAVFICGETEVMVPWRMVPREWKKCMWLAYVSMRDYVKSMRRKGGGGKGEKEGKLGGRFREREKVTNHF